MTKEVEILRNALKACRKESYDNLGTKVDHDSMCLIIDTALKEADKVRDDT